MLKTLALAPALLAAPSLASAETASFTAVFGGKNVGHLIAETKGDTTTIDFAIKNNARGPPPAGGPARVVGFHRQGIRQDRQARSLRRPERQPLGRRHHRPCAPEGAEH